MANPDANAKFQSIDSSLTDLVEKKSSRGNNKTAYHTATEMMAAAGSYDNSTSGLTATTVQAAIDEVDADLDTAEATLATTVTDLDTAEATILLMNPSTVSVPTTIKTDISAANILAMNGTPVTAVAAPGAGFALEFISAVLIYDYATATYTGGGDVTIEYAGGAAVSTTIGSTDAFAAAGDKVFDMKAVQAAGGFTMPVNTALDITNASGAFVDPGTAIGVGRLHITYRVHTTGL